MKSNKIGNNHCLDCSDNVQEKEQIKLQLAGAMRLISDWSLISSHELNIISTSQAVHLFAWPFRQRPKLHTRQHAQSSQQCHQRPQLSTHVLKLLNFVGSLHPQKKTKPSYLCLLKIGCVWRAKSELTSFAYFAIHYSFPASQLLLAPHITIRHRSIVANITPLWHAVHLV